MRLQVQQLEKEKKDMQERMRIIAKRLDHTERAFRKEEIPLLAHDYEQQQTEDRVAFEIAQKTRLEASRHGHQADLETKKRLSRLLSDYKGRREYYISRRGDEFKKRREDAERKIEKEKAKRREAVLKAREEERHRLEEEERILREKEEEERRREEGLCLSSTYYFSFDSSVLQNALQRKRELRKRKKPRRLLKRQRSARRKKRGQSSAEHARKNAKKRSSKPNYSDNAKRKRKLVAKPAASRHLNPQRQLRRPREVPKAVFGVVRPLLHLLLLHVLQTQFVQKVRLVPRSFALLPCVVRVPRLGAVGVHVRPRQGSSSQRLGQQHLSVRLLLPERSLQRAEKTMMASRRFLARMFGDHLVVVDEVVFNYAFYHL